MSIKIILPFLALGSSELEPTTSEESMTWFESLDEEQRTYLTGEGFEDLTGQSYESMGLLFSHEERVKIAYDKLKLEGFDV